MLSRRGQEPSSNPAAGPAHPSFRRQGGTLLSSTTVALEATVCPRGGGSAGRGGSAPPRQPSQVPRDEGRSSPIEPAHPGTHFYDLSSYDCFVFPPRVHCILSQSSTSTFILLSTNTFPFLFPVCFAFCPPSSIPSLLPSAISHSPSPLSLVSRFAFYTVFPPHFIAFLQILINLNSFIANTADIHISLNKSLTLDILYSST